MNSCAFKQFYEDDAARFWDPRVGMRGRDLTIYPLLKGLLGSVLEYGAGSGSLLLSLALEQRFTSLTGIDISENALGKIREAWHEMSAMRGICTQKLTLITPCNDTLPSVPDNSVDVILSLDTIEHVLNPYTVLDELYRIGSRDSTFVISVPNYGYIKYVVQLLLGRQPVTGSKKSVERWRDAGWDGWHLHTFTRQSLEILLRDCGWYPVLWTGYGDKGKGLGMGILRKKFPALWSGALTVVCKRKA